MYCWKHGLDEHLIDRTLTYSENKAYLKSQVPDFNPEHRLDEWDAAEEEYLANHFLWHYLICVKEGANKSAEVGEVPESKPRFSLREMRPIEQCFSLRTRTLK
jgi:hypothetical protein